MPIYEYRCTSCGFQKEFLQKVSDPKLTVCPECGRESFNKMLTAAAFSLKGSGWYASDFKNGGAKPADSKGDSKGDSKDSGGGGGDTDKGTKSLQSMAHSCAGGACACN
jgi:putative FmdB family regulatory protein